MSGDIRSTPLSWQEHQTKLLASELRFVLSLFTDSGDLYNLLEEPLSVKRRGLALQAMHDTPWHLLPLIACESICGDFEPAIPVGASMQLMLAAGDVFDDIEDDDSPESLTAKYGPAVSLNAATTLLILAERAIMRLTINKVRQDTIISCFEALNTYYSTACMGQHMDLSVPQGELLSEEDYINIISKKSASQIECACHIGALVATSDNSIIKNYSMFGYNLGMASQITNDIMGITSGKDIAKYKLTLPVIFALTNASKKERTEIKRYFVNPSEETSSTEQIKKYLIDSGALYYTTLKKELYRQKALDTLSKITNTGFRIDKMKLFLQ